MYTAIRNVLCQLLLADANRIPGPAAHSVGRSTVGAMVTAGLVRPVGGRGVVTLKLTAKGVEQLGVMADLGDRVVLRMYDTIRFFQPEASEEKTH